jgi:hypothetical protein
MDEARGWVPERHESEGATASCVDRVRVSVGSHVESAAGLARRRGIDGATMERGGVGEK